MSAALAAYTTLLASNTSRLPTAVLLPCTHFVSKGLSAGEVTDFDLRISIFGTADSVAYAWPSSIQAPLLRSFGPAVALQAWQCDWDGLKGYVFCTSVRNGCFVSGSA